MSNRREKLLLSGGVLVGFGAGLCVGAVLFFTAVAFILLHNVFLLGVQWLRLLVFPVVPLIAFGVGGWLLWRARRLKYER